MKKNEMFSRYNSAKAEPSYVAWYNESKSLNHKESLSLLSEANMLILKKNPVYSLTISDITARHHYDNGEGKRGSPNV